QENELILPKRKMKPRKKGLTILIDNGAPLNFFQNTINSFSNYIDFVNFGWGNSVVTNVLPKKINGLRDHDIEFFFCVTLFELYLLKLVKKMLQRPTHKIHRHGSNIYNKIYKPELQK